MSGWQLVLVLVASLVGAAVKSVTGLGYPVIAVPIIALALGIEDAVVIVALPNLGANLYLWYESRDATEGDRYLPSLLVTGVIGAVVGTYALVSLPAEPLLLALAATVVVFVVQFLRRPDIEWSPSLIKWGSPVVGMFVGVAQGAVGVSGPIVASWVHGFRLDPRAYVHLVTAIFGVTGAVQIIALAVQGQFTGQRLLGSLAAAVAVVAVTPFGVRLRDRLAGESFDRAVLAVLVVSAASLVVDAVA